MKRKLIAALLALCLASLGALTAFAAPVKQEPTETNGKAFRITYNGATDGNQYVLLIVKAEKGADLTAETPLQSLDVDSILYIDQAAASGTSVTFDGGGNGLQLKTHTSARIYICGQELDAPLNIGYIEVDGVEVTGTIEYYEGYNPATVELWKEGGSSAELSVETTASTGAYAFDSVPADSYVMKVRKPGYAAAQKAVTIEDAGDLGTFGFKKYAGDISGDGTIDIFDLSDFLSDFDKAGNEIGNINTDIDGSGATDIFDLGYLLGNFDSTPTED